MIMKIYEQKIPNIHYFHYIEDMEYTAKERRSGSRGKNGAGERNNRLGDHILSNHTKYCILSMYELR